MQLGPQSCFATRVGIGRKHRTHKVSSPFKSSQVDLSDLGVFGIRVFLRTCPPPIRTLTRLEIPFTSCDSDETHENC